jgi:hypothetical protein
MQSELQAAPETPELSSDSTDHLQLQQQQQHVLGSLESIAQSFGSMSLSGEMHTTSTLPTSTTTSISGGRKSPDISDMKGRIKSASPCHSLDRTSNQPRCVLYSHSPPHIRDARLQTPSSSSSPSRSSLTDSNRNSSEPQISLSISDSDSETECDEAEGGVFQFPFEIRLPENCPATLCHSCARIVYTITATLLVSYRSKPLYINADWC